MTDRIAPNTMKIDLRGQVCPSSLLVVMDNLNRHCSALKAGTLHLLILTDNREALHTIPSTVESMGYIAKITTMPEGHYEIMITLSGQERP